MATQQTNTKQLQKEVNRLNERVVELVDEIFVLKSDLKKFKSDVSNDVKYLTDRVDG